MRPWTEGLKAFVPREQERASGREPPIEHPLAFAEMVAAAAFVDFGVVSLDWLKEREQRRTSGPIEG